MASRKITKRVVDTLKPAESEFVVWDNELACFGVRVRPSGAMTYVVQYRAGRGRGAPSRKMTLGRVGQLTPDEARLAARRTLGAVAHGADPVGKRRLDREALSVADLANRFMAEHVNAKRKPTTAALYSHLVDSYIVPSLGGKKAATLAKVDVAKLHHDLRDRPYLANRTLAVLGSLYAWAGRHGLAEEGYNPTARIEKFPEGRRERFLTADELERLGAAIRKAETKGIPWDPDSKKPNAKHAPKPDNRQVVISPSAAAALRLLLFTGARLREILHLRWEHVDLSRGLLLLPDSKTGRKTIVLNAPAMAVLASLPRVGIYVIAGDDPQKPRSDLKRPWAVVSREARLQGVRIHDLRHSFASFGAGGGLGLPIIGKLLGHTQASTTQRYAHLDADPLRRASDAIGNTIAAAMGEGTRPGLVVAMAHRARK